MFEVHGSSARVAGDGPLAGSTDLNRELTAPSQAAAPRGDHGGLDHHLAVGPLVVQNKARHSPDGLDTADGDERPTRRWPEDSLAEREQPRTDAGLPVAPCACARCKSVLLVGSRERE